MWQATGRRGSRDSMTQIGMPIEAAAMAPDTTQPESIPPPGFEESQVRSPSADGTPAHGPTTDQPVASFAPGSAGASAAAECARRRTQREQSVMARHPRVGRLLLAVSDPPQHERAWAKCAYGERRTQVVLDERCPEVPVLHDRRAKPGSRANIDHIAVSAKGVWVIDSKNLSGRPEIRRWEGSRTLRSGVTTRHR